jgi:hypothetical protein
MAPRCRPSRERIAGCRNPHRIHSECSVEFLWVLSRGNDRPTQRHERLHDARLVRAEPRRRPRDPRPQHGFSDGDDERVLRPTGVARRTCGRSGPLDRRNASRRRTSIAVDLFRRSDGHDGRHQRRRSRRRTAGRLRRTRARCRTAPPGRSRRGTTRRLRARYVRNCGRSEGRAETGEALLPRHSVPLRNRGPQRKLVRAGALGAAQSGVRRQARSGSRRSPRVHASSTASPAHATGAARHAV